MSTSHQQSLSGSPILVPLDGSARAESALPIAQYLAECLDTPLLLARVVTPMPAAYAAPYASMPPGTLDPSMSLPPETYQNLLNSEKQQADTYLNAQAQALAAGLHVGEVVAEGDPASELLDICAEAQVGMVVMTTHGRTGLARFALGSVADRLVRYSHVPVLLQRSHDDSPASTAPETDAAAREVDHALVPLDGSEFAEAVLPVVEELAVAQAIHQITLQRVLPFSAAEEIQTEARGYLEARAEELRGRLASRDCKVYTFLREGTAPSEKIIDQAEAEQCLVVMATHGRGGLKRLVLGSVADQVVHTGHVPVLLIRPQNDGTPSS
jgi:nucleotide-binding universal stress UspA family protein